MRPPSRLRAVAPPDHRMPDIRMFGTTMLLSMVFVSSAWASGSGMPWENPLNEILESVQGPVAKIVSVIIITVTGLTLAFGETSGVVLNKDGSFQRTAKIRGPDLDSATPAELVGVTGRLNNALRRLGSGWAVFVEAQRVPATLYPESDFPDAASQMVDLERREQFEDAHVIRSADGGGGSSSIDLSEKE